MNKAYIVQLATGRLGVSPGGRKPRFIFSGTKLIALRRMDLLTTYGVFFKDGHACEPEWFIGDVGSSDRLGLTWQNKNERQSYFVRAL